MANTRRNRLWTDGVEHWLTRVGEGDGLRDGALLTETGEGLREWNTG